MSPSFKRHPSSYRDPSGFLFVKDGILYRQVNKVFQKDFDQFIEGRLYHHLVEKEILIPHRTIPENLTGSVDWHATLQPETVPFISYPAEWCFQMLKDAALLTLKAAKEAMAFDMLLKDASAYNIQWHKGKMMFIDTLSFERYDEQKPWIAYRQFCEHFFAPLALAHYLKEPLQNLFIAYPDGIPLHLAARMLPFKTKLQLHSYLHVHLQNSITKKNNFPNKESRSFSKQKMKNLLQSLEDGINSFSFSPSASAWSDYYEEANQRGDYVPCKKKIIGNWLNKLRINTILDAGANEGEFSELAANTSSYVISTDIDHGCINKFYNGIKQKGIANICPLIIDMAAPSPGIGVNNEERASFSQRTKVDLVLALALVHHLAIGKNIPFDRITDMFSSLGNYLIIEFVPKDDQKVKLMLQQKRDIYSWYSEGEFITAVQKKFTIAAKENIGNSGRTLYLMKAHEK